MKFTTSEYKSGLISTNCIKINDEKFDTNLTTPDSYEINFYLNEMVSHGVEYCFMEVSLIQLFNIESRV